MNKQNNHRDLLAFVDESVRPQEDFFRYVNGRWIDSVEIPDDKSSWGIFYELHEKSLTDTKSLLEADIPNSEFMKAKLFYSTGVNFKKRDNDDITPLTPYLEQIKAIKSKKDLIDTIIDLKYEAKFCKS